jgi:uncharacterized caspase-like protein
MRRLILFFLMALVGSCLSLGEARADKRVALVVGNSAYKNAPRLANPANDAAAIAAMFRVAQFDVVELRQDLGNLEMRRLLREFSDRAKDADMAVVYYAGHGLEVDGVNYLIPVDAILERDGDAYDEAISLDRVLQTIEPARRLRLVVLDACRDNPFVRAMKRTLATRALGRGLAGVEPGKPNTLIAFAAKGGSTADDGAGNHSPFTTALLAHLTTPGLDLRRAFGLIRDDVMKATGDRQEPFVYGSLGGSDVSLVPPPQVQANQPQANPQAEVRRDYELALQVATEDAWNSFLRQYPNGFYADLAKSQLSKIAAEDARVAATEKAKAADDQRARLAAENASTAAQAKAAADSKAAEDARVAAEKTKKDEAARADAAERARAAAERAAADKAAKEQAEASAKPIREQAPAAATASSDGGGNGATRVAALPPAGSAALSQQDIARGLQTELRRVGCFSGSVDGEWKTPSQRALDQFNKFAGVKLDVKLAGVDALDAVKAKTGRVCPLVCDHGSRADGDRCAKIVCKAGYEVGDLNTCEKIAPVRPVAKRTEPPSPAKHDEPPKSQASGNGQQVICTSGGCRPVGKNCRLVSGLTTSNTNGVREVCD